MWCLAMNKLFSLIDRLEATQSLTLEEYKYLIENRTDEAADYIAQKAQAVRIKIYGKDVYIRGLIEVSNICKNNCLYCGIRNANKECSRYRLDEQDILACC